eukprot:464349-Amphidinium_carterae.1
MGSLRCMGGHVEEVAVEHRPVTAPRAPSESSAALRAAPRGVRLCARHCGCGWGMLGAGAGIGKGRPISCTSCWAEDALGGTKMPRSTRE